MNNAKIVPIRGTFENPAAFAAHLAEHSDIIGFVGVVIRLDEHNERCLDFVNIKATRKEVAHTSVILSLEALRGIKEN